MQSIDQLVQNLISGDENRAEESARSFPAYGEDGIQILINLCEDKDADIRWWALRALAAFDPVEHPNASESLIRGLRDPEISVQACAAVGLREKPAAKAVQGLIELLADEDKLLARLAGDALAASGKAAVPGLIQLIEQIGEEHSIRKVEAVRALALIAEPASILTLFNAWEHGSSMVQYWAERGLNEMGIGMAFFDPGK